MAARVAGAPRRDRRGSLVEDDDDVGALTGEMLQELGFTVTGRARRIGCTRCRARGRSDIMMPGGMNGAGTAHEPRRRGSELPVLLTSGYTADVRSEAERDGMAILSKALRPRQSADHHGCSPGEGRRSSDLTITVLHQHSLECEKINRLNQVIVESRGNDVFAI